MLGGAVGSFRTDWRHRLDVMGLDVPLIFLQSIHLSNIIFLFFQISSGEVTYSFCRERLQ
jgi:hypothetical protein